MYASPRVYSYLRFSNAKQASGASIARQLDYAVKWAEQHGMELDTSLTLKDEGLSAFHEKHIEKGNFGVFLKAIEDGLIPPGSVLIVESLDRLSRAEPIIAQAQLYGILIAGIEVVTAADNTRISLESVKKNPGILFLALGVSMRANEESERKKDRILDAAHRNAQAWQAGTSRKRAAVGKDPGWVKYNAKTNEYELLPEFVTPLMAMLGYFRAGASTRRCFAMLHEAGIPLPPPKLDLHGKLKKTRMGNVISGLANTTRLYDIMSNRALIGEKTIVLGKSQYHDAQTYVLSGYYPPLMTEAEFEELQQMRKQGGRVANHQSRIVGIINGVGITKCMRCRSAMAGQNVLSRSRRADGKPQDGHRRLICTGVTKAKNLCTESSVSIVPIERAIMAYCSDQMNLTALFTEQEDQSRNLNGQLALARAAVAQTEAAMQKLLDAIEAAGDDTPAMFIQRARKREIELKTQQQAVADLEYKIESAHRASRPAMAEVWAKLRNGVEQLDPAARTKARLLVVDTFKRIEIKRATDRGQDLIEIRLESKQNVRRGFLIDRKTGAFYRGDHVENESIIAKPTTRPTRARRVKAAA
ncbi:integrase [Caballeronia jiangsuensis]|nr:integrase [Caballeronia jiangsuensis]